MLDRDGVSAAWGPGRRSGEAPKVDLVDPELRTVFTSAATTVLRDGAIAKPRAYASTDCPNRDAQDQHPREGKVKSFSQGTRGERSR
jgi:hypothetical protein